MPVTEPKRTAVAVVFKQVMDGDVRKLAAQSNDSPTGGGARDLRFPMVPFQGPLTKFFPNVVGHSANGGPVRQGTMVWVIDSRNQQKYNVELHPPTNARPREIRIARIHDLDPMQHCPTPTDSDPVFLFLTLDTSSTFRCDFARLSDLSRDWHPEIAQLVRRSLVAMRGKNAACGFKDFQTETEYVHE